MKKNSFIRLCLLPLLFAIVALSPACKKNNADTGRAPVITSVRMYNPSPKDTLLSSGNPATDPTWSGGTGKYVVIIGQNLQNATHIEFDGVPATFNPALFAPNSAVVQIPAIMFSAIDTTKLYTLSYKTTGGSTTFSFKLGPAAPTITAISNVFANPGDSVHVFGTNLVLVHSFSYGGTPITSFNPSADGTSIGFLMPAQTPTDQVIVATKTGTVNFKIVATPTITGISDEDANPGDSVYVYGTYLKNIQSLSFAGTAITSFTSSKDGTSVGFVLPTLSQSGPVSVTTKFGTGTTLYNVNDYVTGAIANMEWSGPFGWSWNGGSLYTGTAPGDWRTYDAAFSGITTNSSQYVAMKTNVLKAGEGAAGWPPTYEIYFGGGTQWVPAANLNDPPSNWALKFDVSVPQAWNGGTIDIVTGVGGYIARWQPWQKTATATAPYTTKGWITVTIPLSSFRASDPTLGEGMGASVSQIVGLIGPTGNPSWTVYIHNYGAGATATGFYGAFDNFRVVKIK
ncbi:glycan-binding surface protein [Mucilaginibacter sp. BT774]|uniref:glycan-binding surface protein n=1 Tax=Mucilaginibacter sp. BT774 TaxID=3062276 RepID=UPI002674BBAE|nr:glycan-binding surface protein [Mucilaginibacter sp. BT774]MDO3628951.1 glycan-binding surface protein [Mucilaginibacter sp. BT774]